MASLDEPLLSRLAECEPAVQSLEPLSAEVLEEYKAIAEGVASLSGRRQMMNDVFAGINALFLTALGFLLATSHMTSWTVVAATGAIALVIFPVNWTWYVNLKLYRDSLRIHYDSLMKIESRYRFVANLHTRLSPQAAMLTRRFRRSTTTAEMRLATYFLLVYPLIALAAAILTFLVTNQVISAVTFS